MPTGTEIAIAAARPRQPGQDPVPRVAAVPITAHSFPMAMRMDVVSDFCFMASSQDGCAGTGPANGRGAAPQFFPAVEARNGCQRLTARPELPGYPERIAEAVGMKQGIGLADPAGFGQRVMKHCQELRLVGLPLTCRLVSLGGV